MSPHRLTTIRRFKIPDDVLISILLNLDPVSLYRTCKVIRRVYVLVMEFQPLYYKYELALAGMKDGPVSYAAKPPRARLHLLKSYRKDWHKLSWTHENPFSVPTSARVKVSGGFLHYTGNQVIDLIELPSCRTGRSPAQTRHLRYQISPNSQMECIAIDALQSLVVTSEIFGAPGGFVGLRVGIRDLWTFGKHPAAPSPFYDFNTQVGDGISSVSAVICGAKIAISFQSAGGKAKHLLLEWHTFQAVCLEDQDIHFLNENYLLVSRRSRGSSKLYLYNVSSVAKAIPEREYELPIEWAHSAIEFGRNTAPTTELCVSPTALFFSDPSTRVLLVVAKPTGVDRNRFPFSNWLFINESYFRPPSRKDYRTQIPWSYWGQYCLIRNIPNSRYIGSPRIVGTRIVYSEAEPTHSSGHGGHTRLHVIDFAPCLNGNNPTVTPGAWTLVGQGSLLVPNETYREIPTKTTNGLKVEDTYITEDNIILSLGAHHGVKPVNVLTFDAPPVRVSRHEVYSPQF